MSSGGRVGLFQPGGGHEAPHRSAKSLAQGVNRTETRLVMNGHATPRLTTNRQAIVAGILCVVFLATIALSVSPFLHALIHSDAAQAEHSCVVTLIASGSCDHVAPPSLPVGAVKVNQFAILPALTPRWVASPFLEAHIFEHAPPASS